MNRDFFLEAVKMDVPIHTASSLEKYILYGTQVGGFLYAYLSNDLAGALGRADHKNLKAFVNIGKFLYNYAPSGCWGEQEYVEKWIRKGGLDKADNNRGSSEDDK